MTEPGSSSSPRGKSKPRRLAVVTGAVLAIGFGVAYGLHFLGNPWALSLPGHPGLVGYWQGEMTLPSGDRRRVFLELNGVLPSSTSCGNCPKMDGTAKVCGKPNMAYEVYGHPLNYRGTRFSLGPRTTAEGAGTYLGQLEGNWDRADLLKIRTTLIHKDANGVAHATTDTDQPAEPPVQISMRRTSEAIFDAGC
jgi:hypothetical protein